LFAFTTRGEKSEAQSGAQSGAQSEAIMAALSDGPLSASDIENTGQFSGQARSKGDAAYWLGGACAGAEPGFQAGLDPEGLRPDREQAVFCTFVPNVVRVRNATLFFDINVDHGVFFDRNEEFSIKTPYMPGILLLPADFQGKMTLQIKINSYNVQG